MNQSGLIWLYFDVLKTKASDLPDWITLKPCSHYKRFVPPDTGTHSNGCDYTERGTEDVPSPL